MIINSLLIIVTVILIKEGCSQNNLVKWEIKEFDKE
jgi:hypothetical protein